MTEFRSEPRVAVLSEEELGGGCVRRKTAAFDREGALVFETSYCVGGRDWARGSSVTIPATAIPALAALLRRY